MKNKFKILIPVIIASLSLVGCRSNFAKISNQKVKITSQVETYNLVKYKDSYVGDNNSEGNIIVKLPANEYNARFSLQTNKQPYGITINYKVNQILCEKFIINFGEIKILMSF